MFSFKKQAKAKQQAPTDQWGNTTPTQQELQDTFTRQILESEQQIFLYFVRTTRSESYLVTRVVEELQPLVDVLAGAEQVEQLLVVDLQQGDFDRELRAVLWKLLKDLVQRSGDDASQRVLKKTNPANTGSVTGNLLIFCSIQLSSCQRVQTKLTSSQVNCSSGLLSPSMVNVFPVPVWP